MSEQEKNPRRKTKRNTSASEKKRICFLDYLDGKTLEQISKKNGVKYGTLGTWHKKDKWGFHKEITEEISKKTIFGQYAVKVEESTKKYLEGSRILAQMGLEVLIKAYEANQHLPRVKEKKIDKATGKEIEVETDQIDWRFVSIAEWMKILNGGADLQRKALPNMDEEMMELINEEIVKLNESYSRGLYEEDVSSPSGEGDREEKPK